MRIMMKKDEIPRTPFAKYPEGLIIDNYKEIAINMLHLNYPTLSLGEISAAVDWSISKHFKDSEAVINNNYKKVNIDTTLLKLTDFIISKEPIITSYGVLFSKHASMPNPVYEMLDGFIADRGIEKKEAFKYPKGSDEYAKHWLLQALLKIDANAYYGSSGMYSCIYYNIYAAASTTTQGRSANSAAALFFESFLNNNVPMGSMNEVIEFIYNVLKEEHHYNIEDVICNHASIDETFFQLLSSSGFGWIPTKDEMQIIWDILSKLNQEELDRIFYKNNLFNFVDNPPVKDTLIYILQALTVPYIDPNNPPEEIIPMLNEFTNIIKEFVYYGYQIIDRLEKMDSLIRSVSIIQDTDSAIVSLDGWYQYARQYCFGVPMAIKNEVADVVDIIDGNRSAEISKEYMQENDFVDDDYIESHRLINPMIIVPQEGLRYSIINILSYVMGKLVNEYINDYATGFHTDNARPCLLTLKNEFLFKRVLVKRDAKKNYASKMELQEGNIIPEDKSLDIKGLPTFIKSTTNPTTQKRLKEVLYEDILNAESINPIKVQQDIRTIENEIYESINRGEKLFFKPAKIKSVSGYENPMRIQGIVASMAYNELHQEGTEAIDLSIRNSIDIIKVDINRKNIDKIKESFPDVYEKAVKLLNTEEFKSGISSIALPQNELVPEWVIPFIEYAIIINDNISGFPIESIGINRGHDRNNITNMINF